LFLSVLICVHLMNTLLDKIYATGKVEDRDGNPLDCFPTSVSHETGLLLYDLVRARGFKKTLEIGMAYGLSSLFICQALKDNGAGLHTACDPAQDTAWQSIGLLNLKRAGLDHLLRFFEASSHDALPRLYSEGERFDFAFIDGMHLFDYVLVDFFYVDRLLEVGGCVALDDIWMPAVQKVISFVLKNRSYKLVKTAAGSKPTLLRHAASAAKRFYRNPSVKDMAVKLIPGNVCVIEKLADDDRHWKYHRAF
jgi:predicted O-methyltransferase YrrM